MLSTIVLSLSLPPLSHEIIEYIFSVEKTPQGFQADEDHQWVGESLHSGISVQFLPDRSVALPLVSHRLLGHKIFSYQHLKGEAANSLR